jgi:hypothetical protein
MGHHLTYGEGKGPKEIELRNNPQHLSFFYYGEELKSCFSNNASSSRMVVWRVTVVAARVIY